MDGHQTVYTLLGIVLMVANVVEINGDSEYMTSKPESIVIPVDYDTVLTCEMNIDPDKFVWKFYPADDPFDSNSNISLNSNNYRNISHENNPKKRNGLLKRVGKREYAGEYQCLAYYGAYVVASIPWKISLARMRDFPNQRDISVTVTTGNTVAWMCEPPESNPEAYIDYFKGSSNLSLYLKTEQRILILSNVTQSDSGQYKCKATNTVTYPTTTLYSKAVLNLRVVSNDVEKPPEFLMPQKRVYKVTKGSKVFLECSAVGNPPPRVVWFKLNGQLPYKRSQMVPGGLIIENITSEDDGAYRCNHTNSRGSKSHLITLIYNEEPSVDCHINSTVKEQSDQLDLECSVKGIPEPQITWFLNGYKLSENDKDVEIVGNKIYFNPLEKKHAGNLQCFARNEIGTAYDSISIKVIPLTTSIDIAPTPTHSHRRPSGKPPGTRKSPKHKTSQEMVPPTKPIISRLDDESVAVRWSVPPNNGLPIQFFKVQYRELGPANSNDKHEQQKSRWRTTNADIAPNIQNFDVTNLKTEYVYRFRIAAVYSNNDNNLSPNSDKFILRRMDFDNRNPLLSPIITHTEPVSDTSIKIYWKYTSVPNITIDGFYISYLSASTAGDYTKATADGEDTRSYTITHLQPDTVYDIKIQSFTPNFSSEFSPIMKAKTAARVSNTPSTLTPISSSSEETGGMSQLYISIAGGVIVVAVLIIGVVLLLVCRKWQRSKNTDNQNKPAVDDHHIQVDGNEYVVGPKPQQRSNGCTLSSNRMTITPNPLADADNKNQNMMEMSCLASQNNNCSVTPTTTTTASAIQSSASGHESASNSNEKTKTKCKSPNKQIMESTSSRENYV